MDIVVAGGHGQIALLVLELLAEDGHRARGLIRNPDHAADLEQVGAEPVVADLEREGITEAVAGADAVVFAAGWRRVLGLGLVAALLLAWGRADLFARRPAR